MAVTISLQLNTGRNQHRIIQIKEKILSKYNEKQLMKHLIKITKGKFNLKKKSPERFFVSQTGEELTLSNINIIISSHYATTLKKGLSLLVSFGEDYIGKVITHPFKRTNKQQTLVSIIISYNICNIHIDILQHMSHLILSYLPKPIQLPLMSSETQRIIRHMFKSMSTFDKLQKQSNKSFNNTYKDCTRSIYSALRDECIKHNNAKPPGLNIQYITNIDLISAARKEIDFIFDKLLILKPHLSKSSNLKFYVNTAYYSRWEADPWPMFRMNDKRIESIVKCVSIAGKLLGVEFNKEKDKKLLNIIIRQYRAGDVLGFHTDRNEFIEPICGIVLRNNNAKTHSLMFYKDGIKPFLSPEKEGVCWCIRDEARWEYKHGLCMKFENEKSKGMKKGKRDRKRKNRQIMDELNSNVKNEVIRTSISFRWFKQDATLPRYDHQNDL
eukprot:273499_1